jgi:hypothetical protein
MISFKELTVLYTVCVRQPICSILKILNLSPGCYATYIHFTVKYINNFQHCYVSWLYRALLGVLKTRSEQQGSVVFEW